jgi:hypothetical protein
MSDTSSLAAPMTGTERTTFAGIATDTVTVGDARVKRVVYPAGLRWSVDVRPLAGGEHCLHAHVGFLVQGRLAGEYADGCTFDFTAPQVVAVDPGHDAWIPGDDDAILLEVDFVRETTARFGIPAAHHH